MMTVKYPVKKGLSFDDVVEAMKTKANEINFKFVGVNPLWRDVIANKLQGRKLTRLILTHYHPDHIGLAGWFSGELGLEVWMNPTEHRHGRKAHRGPSAEERELHADFFRRHGLAEEAVQGALSRAGTSDASIRSTVTDPKTFNASKGDLTRDIISAPQGDGRGPSDFPVVCLQKAL